MFNGFLLIVFLVFGFGVGIIYNKLFIKDYPDYKRKPGYFFTVVVFAVFLCPFIQWLV
jgi:hypothetical protein